MNETQSLRTTVASEELMTRGKGAKHFVAWSCLVLLAIWWIGIVFLLCSGFDFFKP